MNFFWLVFWDSRNQKTNAINISLLVFGLKYLIPLLDFFYFSTTWARWTWPSRMFNSLLTLSFIVKFKGKPHWTKTKVNQELHQVRTSATTEVAKLCNVWIGLYPYLYLVQFLIRIVLLQNVLKALYYQNIVWKTDHHYPLWTE